MTESITKIKVGDYVIIQRQKYTKLHKFSNLESTAMLGKDQVELRNIDGRDYFSTFKMVQKEGKKRISSLEICTETDMRNIREVLGIKESGLDNRNITDDGGSEGLKPEDIDKLREECTASSQILGKIVESSKTFSSKTEYSQEKYLKKKEKKYFEFVQIRQPSIRLMAEIYYRQDPEKIIGIRMDTLSQIISYSGISSFGNYLLYESGTCGLIPAAFLNSIGAGTKAQLVHMHPGNVPQQQAVLALNLPEEQLNRCISVNIYSVLREFHQGEPNTESSCCTEVVSKRPAEVDIEFEVPCKKSKIDDLDNGGTENLKTEHTQSNSNKSEPLATPKWQIENKRACELLREKFDSLVIIAREHPLSILKTLLPFLKPSRPVVIFNLCKEILMEIYVDLKTSSEITGLHLTSNWMRMYQILPNRTHPEVNMSSNSGYLLHGYTVQ